MDIIKSQRQLFDIPDNIAYFNCAYNSPLLVESKNRLLAGAEDKCHPWERTAESFFNDAETIRNLSSTIFYGKPDDYAVVPSASYGISTAARAIEPNLKSRDKILLMDEEFPSNVLPWQRVSKETGVQIVTVPTPENSNWTQAILDKIDKTIKVVAISSCHWTNGAKIDLEEIGKACREYDCVFVVDATQTLGAMPLSVEKVKPDFMVASGYKWLLCPYGFSLLYVSERWQKARPLEETWIARENAENFATLVNYSDQYKPGARRFEVGQKCTPTIQPGAIAALEQIKNWGVPNITTALSNINNCIASHLQVLGFRLPDDAQRCPHMFGAILPKSYQGNLINELKKRNIFISQRGNSLRFAPHLHINDNDLDRLLNALTELIK